MRAKNLLFIQNENKAAHKTRQTRRMQEDMLRYAVFVWFK